MLLSKSLVHGIYALCYLSRQPAGTVADSATVAEAMDVPVEQAAKILQRLRGAGMVRSVRGRVGGYMLAQRLDQINMAKLYEAFFPRGERVVVKSRPCSLEPGRTCCLHDELWQLQDEIYNVLAARTVAAVLSGGVTADQCGAGV